MLDGVDEPEAIGTQTLKHLLLPLHAEGGIISVQGTGDSSIKVVVARERRSVEEAALVGSRVRRRLAHEKNPELRRPVPLAQLLIPLLAVISGRPDRT